VHEIVSVVRAGRCEGESAVPADDGRHAVQGRGAGGRVPEQLGVVVGVQIHEARSDDQPGGIERAPGSLPRVGIADADHPAAPDSDVGDPTRPAGAVHHSPTADDAVEHGC